MRVLQILPFPHKPNIVAITSDFIHVHRSMFRPWEGTIYSVRKIEKAKSPTDSRKTFRSKVFSYFLDWFEQEYGEFSIGMARDVPGGRPRVSMYQIETMHDLYMAGYSIREIAVYMGLGYASVAGYIRSNDWNKWERGTRNLIGDMPDPWGAWGEHETLPRLTRRVSSAAKYISAEMESAKRAA